MRRNNLHRFAFVHLTDSRACALLGAQPTPAETGAGQDLALKPFKEVQMPADTLATKPENSIAPVEVDFLVASEGASLVLFLPLSLEADAFAEGAFLGAMTWGNARVVETDRAEQILFDIIVKQGFVARVDGQLWQAPRQ